jgi:hypothetical protein
MCSKFVAVVCLAILCVAVSGFDLSGKGTAKGSFKYKDNNGECSWHEVRTTRSMRSLYIQCKGKTEFSTEYEGDPHKCNWYLKGNQLKYYECLNAALIKAKFSANSPSEISCDKHNCGDVIFKKSNGNHLHRVIKKVLAIKEMITEEEDSEDWNEFDSLSINY